MTLEEFALLIAASLWPFGVHYGDALHCAHYTKGVCHATGATGVCVLDTGTGYYGCAERDWCTPNNAAGDSWSLSDGRDDEKGVYCVDGGTRCCCNTDYCNYNVLNERSTNNVQTCHNDMWSTTSSDHFQPCRDAWCYTLQFNYSDTASGEARAPQGRGAWRGCQTQIHSTLDLWKEVADARWANMRPFFVRSCATLMHDPQHAAKGTRHGDKQSPDAACFSILHTTPERFYDGQLCCCRGADRCNRGTAKRRDFVATQPHVANGGSSSSSKAARTNSKPPPTVATKQSSSVRHTTKRLDHSTSGVHDELTSVPDTKDDATSTWHYFKPGETPEASIWVTVHSNGAARIISALGTLMNSHDILRFLALSLLIAQHFREVHIVR